MLCSGQTPEYRRFSWKDSNFRICSDRFDSITAEIVNLRRILEQYIAKCPEFRSALEPVELLRCAPEVVCRMSDASRRVGVGPMAAVAGTIAQMAAEAGLRDEASEAIVENGGDIYIAAARDISVALYPGARNPLNGRLAFAINRTRLPVAVCSSSGTMGHSMSLGVADLATVVANSASLADAAATLACNLVQELRDINAVLEKIRQIPGIDGALIIKDQRIGLAGNLPKLVKNTDSGINQKITRDREAPIE